MNQHLHLPYREGNSLVIFDAKIWKAQKLSRRQHKLGLFFSVLGIVGFLSLGSPIIVSELSYRLYRSKRIREVQVISQKKTFGDLLLNDPFTIIIPSINLTANILPNINPANESDYLPALKTGVAHAQGSSFPGQGGLIYLFAHSTDYAFNIKAFNAFFYNLKDLEKGDKITLSYRGRPFNYVVKEKKIVAADDLSDLKNLGQERIVLQTCWPPGTTWKRLLVIADPV